MLWVCYDKCMAIRKIARMGHPCLRASNRELTPQEIRSPEIQALIVDMVDTMEEYEGIGLAAPQIHENIQLALVHLEDDNERYPGHEGAGLGVYINPKMTVLDATEQGFWEGCLSVPEIRGLVYRPRKIQIDYLDQTGKSKSITAEGFLATVFQHELDHLGATLFIDRIRYVPGSSPIAFIQEYQRFLAPHPESDVGELDD